MLKDLEGFLQPGSEEEKLARRIDFSCLPSHVAIIMDGNGRWARRRNLPRLEGHRAGAKSVQETVETCARLGIPYLSLYAFSKENWKRPKKEVTTLWRLLEDYLRKESKTLIDNEFRLMVIGQKESIPPSVRRELDRVEELTRDFSRLTVIMALNYGGRSEIVDAARKLLGDPAVAPETLDERTFSHYLYTAGIPDPDLLIRTSGELRISNFMLWQIAYSEIWITADFWPDFRRKHLLQAVLDYQQRERRFGDIGPPEGRPAGHA
jgi:undecaprenyl diphosphate synthase